MKLTVETKSTVEVEVNFPHYRKRSGQAWIIINENADTLWVTHYGEHSAIEFGKRDINFACTFGEQCTEQEFLRMYTEAQSNLTVQYHELFSKKSNPFINEQSDRAGEI